MNTATPEKAPSAVNTQSAGRHTIRSLSEAELDALLARITEARNHNLALSAEDYDLLMQALSTLASVQERLSHNDLTMARLKKLLGMVNASEKLKDLRGQGKDLGGQGSTEDQPTSRRPSSAKARKPARKKRPTSAPIKPEVVHHKHESLSKGDSCPGCGLGKVYKYEPALLLRITGHSPFSAKQHVSEQLRCNGCGEVFSADLPESVKADGRSDQQYGYSARSVMSINKYFAAIPFYRQQSLQRIFGAHIVASTVWDQCEKVADALHPIFKQLKCVAADATTFYLDDTSNRILNKEAIEKTRHGKTRWRSGVYSSACLALFDQKMDTSPDPPSQEEQPERRVVLFQTNIGHAGEWLEEILSGRSNALDPPLLMSDALSSNHVTTVPYSKALCNAHGRRGFAELIVNHPEQALFALETYAHIWVNDTHCREKNHTPERRQRYHEQHSLPQMQNLLDWCNTELSEQGQVEPNSDLGKAMQYFVRHYEGLSAFCTIPGAPVDNNEVERLIKNVVRNRKNSFFFKNATGAGVSDVITSILATCQENEINAFDYLNSIQRNQLAVKAAPQNWLPWNYPQEKSNSVD